MLGKKFFIFKITEVIASSQVMADTEEHPLVCPEPRRGIADFEHVGAGDIFAFRHAQVFGKIRMQQFAEKFPVLEIF